jgi:succinate-acetate transporter protein
LSRVKIRCDGKIYIQNYLPRKVLNIYGRHLAMDDELANPAPLGLMGFGMTTVLLNLHNAGLIGDTSMGIIFSMGIFYGGMAQILAGMWEMKRGNTFGATAFSSFGLFWISLVALKVFPVLGWVEEPSGIVMATYLSIWGMFTALMTVSTFKTNRALQVVFITLTILFFSLAIGDASGSVTVKTIAGYEGILCGLSAIYLATAEVINETYGKTILPT